ncbi:UMP/CMP kinase [Malassezia caprae]|uniref:UMP/CMP kinase n=1 Tax=Malassezia caprae TaxID=1381934 RepID=A0AAF0E7L4_9BASI|nr:UMP/CMP kinase [Malassezia caprae]
MIADYIKEGKIVPMEVTISLLRNAIQQALRENETSQREGWGDGKGRFLIDGFPRKLDQSHKFEESVCPAQMVLFLQCSEEIMLERLLRRGTFVETSMPVVDYQRSQNKVIDVDAKNPVEQVYQEISKAMEAKFNQIRNSM